MNLVVDASAIAALLVSREEGVRVAERLAGRELFAPQLLIPEVVSTLRGWVLGRHLDPARAEGAIDDFRALDITVVDMFPLVDDAWALRERLTAHDAMYVALARHLRCPLLTLDTKLAAALPSDVEAIGG
ncbi:MAG: type II toxin-antitoxin system VapC family toxin [Dermatophilus congolensis]|nr:type II toxin-antitoxin system VapC family toxin [Dermatophilus congolensis]